MSLGSLLEPFVGPVSTATVAFPVVASVMAIPFALYHYRRHGRVHPWRAFVSYSFVYYLIAAVFLVLLPLPDRPVDQAGLAAWNDRYGALRTPRLDPAGFLRDVTDAGTAARRSRAVAQIAFNVMLLVPFGAYLAYAFRRPLPVVLLLGFLLSLLFETCQLTGIFWIYPGPYRLFDVGDLVLNTTGALVGGVVARLLARVGALPRLEALKGPPDPWIRPFRRAVGVFLDACALLASAVVLTSFADLALPASAALKGLGAAGLGLFWLVLLPAVDRGRGIGKRLTFCAIRRADGKRAGAGRIVARQLALWGVPVLAYGAVSLLPRRGATSVPATAALLTWLGFWLLNALKATFDNEHAGYVDRWLGTRVRDTWGETREPATRRRGGRASPRPRAPRGSLPPRGPRAHGGRGSKGRRSRG
jgi:glycopeptide antibiotics resistance protein